MRAESRPGLLIAVTLGLVTCGYGLGQEGVRNSEALALRATDRHIGAAERDGAFNALAELDFEKAVAIAPLLLEADDAILRARAAWVLADAGQEAGKQVLRAMATERTEESTLAMRSLARIKDGPSHEVLRGLLDSELKREAPDPGRVGALVESLADYGRSSDAQLLARAVELQGGSTSWVLLDALGRTGGPEAVPILQTAFQRSKGWASVSAGLGMARCGSPVGKSYVSARLADPAILALESTASNSRTTAIDGPEATAFILDRLGAPADEIFLPDLLKIIKEPRASSRAKNRAWRSVLRMNPATERSKLVELAWSDLHSDAAVRYLVLNDEMKVRDTLAREGNLPAYERLALTQALAANPRQRRRWRELQGYAL
jgi:hypothetical protein